MHAEMAVSTEELETTVQEVLGRLKSHQFFQSTWDTAAFIIFLIFVGKCGCGLGVPPAPCPGPWVGVTPGWLSCPQVRCCSCCCWSSPTAGAAAAVAPLGAAGQAPGR